MNSPERPRLVFSAYPQSLGFAFVMFEECFALIDWGVYEIRGDNKNARCMRRILSLFELHTPDIVVLQAFEPDRARRVQDLNRKIANLAKRRGMAVQTFTRTRVVNHFAKLGATNKQKIAETIAKYVPALIPPPRKRWMHEDTRMGIFNAAALAWMHCHDIGEELRVV